MALMSRLAVLGAARRYARRNSSQVHGVIDKVASTVKGRTPAAHADKVDRAGSMLKKVVTGRSEPRPTRSAARTRR